MSCCARPWISPAGTDPFDVMRNGVAVRVSTATSPSPGLSALRGGRFFDRNILRRDSSVDIEIATDESSAPAAILLCGLRQSKSRQGAENVILWRSHATS